MADPDEVPFGFLPFDYYVVAHWDPNSALSRKQQKRELVESWTRLGRYGRNETPGLKEQAFLDEAPPYIPRDILTREERAWDGQLFGAFWIRTWFGRKDDQESQDAADAAYKRLFVTVMQEGDENQSNEVLQEELIFDNKEEFGVDSDTTPNGDENPDFVDGIARGIPGSVPSYLITALAHYPDSFDYARDSPWRHHSPSEAEAELSYLNTSQNLMLLVADRKACEEGWVLHLAVNHKGEILPFRVRDRASYSFQIIANLLEGQHLQENASDTEANEECYMSSGDGWAPE